MPTKRRQQKKGKTKHVKKKGIPSEDMDSQSTQDSAEGQDNPSAKEMSIILNSLSRKPLLNSSSDASDYAQKENIPSRLGDPYDADLETTDAASTAGESDMEFSSSQNKKILSPSRVSNSRTTRHRTGGRKTSSEKSTGRKEESPANTDSPLPLDIGVKHRFPKLYASDTSTPQSVGSESKSELNDSAFGFENLASPKDLPFSPVPVYTPEIQHSVSSTTSGVSSLQGSQISTSMTLSTSERLEQKKRPHTVNLSYLVDGGDRRKIKKRRPGAQSEKQQAEDWALKIGEEFNDIEMHELSVE